MSVCQLNQTQANFVIHLRNNNGYLILIRYSRHCFPCRIIEVFFSPKTHTHTTRPPKNCFHLISGSASLSLQQQLMIVDTGFVEGHEACLCKQTSVQLLEHRREPNNFALQAFNREPWLWGRHTVLNGQLYCLRSSLSFCCILPYLVFSKISTRVIKLGLQSVKQLT